MKTTRVLFFAWVTLGIFWMALLALGCAHGAEAGELPAPLPMPTGDPVAAGIVQSVLAALIGKYGWGVAFMSWMTSFRLVFKPFTSAVERFVHATESKRDDIILEKVEASAAWKILCWVIDLVASIKLGPAKAVPVPKTD